MTSTESRVTIHMAASLDGFIARKDGSVDWLETSDEFAGGKTLDPELVGAFLKRIDCYVMGSQTYETALRFEARGLGWAYGDTPTIVLTRRELPRSRKRDCLATLLKADPEKWVKFRRAFAPRSSPWA